MLRFSFPAVLYTDFLFLYTRIYGVCVCVYFAYMFRVSNVTSNELIKDKI